MQLGTLIEKLQGLFSRATLVAAVVPVACFFLLNTAILSCFSDGVGRWFFSADTGTKTVAGLLLAFLLLVAAYVFSSFTLVLRELLEGKGMPRSLATRLVQAEYQRRAELKRAFADAADQRRKIGESRADWMEQLTQGRAVGSGLPTCNYAEDQRPAAVADVFDAISRNSPVSAQMLAAAVTALAKVLSENSADIVAPSDASPAPSVRVPSNAPTPVAATPGAKPATPTTPPPPAIAAASAAGSTSVSTAPTGASTPPGPLPPDPATVSASAQLDADHSTLANVIDEAGRLFDERMVNAYNQLEFDFSRYTLAPTRMGNIGESVRSYARSRYNINLDFMWTRFQRVLQESANAAYFQTLQDAKAQVDFAVAMLWLILVSTGLWLVVLPFVAASFEPILLTGIAGSWLAWLMYQVALQNYRAFAEVMRGSIDLFRMQVLTALKLDAPTNSEAERELWRMLDQSLATGERRTLFFRKDEK